MKLGERWMFRKHFSDKKTRLTSEELNEEELKQVQAKKNIEFKCTAS